MKKTAYFALGSLAALAVLVVGAMSASAAQGQRGEGEMGQRGEKASPEHRAEMQEIMDSGDYNTWAESVRTHAAEDGRDNPRVLENVTADNFNKFIEMHEAMQSGDRDSAQLIREELGMNGFGKKGNRHAGMKGENRGGNFVDSNGDGVCDKFDQ
ncbi:hypothetical protein HOF40_03190 [Candidatus Parcubacteria bacterium]|jgi:hypothetical protein|nr:hypothetical protein [Candidatus Parcubacteria bacterium]MBT3949066.1 hypothetical protein [Candidatus Parcubacteria bacterium]